ncbi:MAG: GMC oxidoreductase [Nocardioides sp.]|uniref:GMC family oxidoreductase n=1 Tax=Nocardioides sp. TaxID=35761 RepID=UPI0039E48A61
MSEFSLPPRVDLLIVGSGPAGSTFARIVHDARPDAQVLMVDVGPKLTEIAGENTRNLPEPDREAVAVRSQGPNGPARLTNPRGRVGDQIAARPGTFLAHQPPIGTDPQRGMPAAAMASAVGGMSAHWTCACPSPGDSEVIGFLDPATLDAALDRARALLHVTQEAFTPTPEGELVRARLSEHFDDGRPADRRVQPMPLACIPQGPGKLPRWSGAAEILGDLAGDSATPGFVLSPETLCRRLIHSEGRVSAAELLHLPTGTVVTVEVGHVVVAADALRSPQLLWASDIRPTALGRYLNDQPQMMSAIALDTSELEAGGDDGDPGRDDEKDHRDALTGVTWVPLHEPELPYHGQMMQLAASPIVVGSATVNRPTIGVGYFLTKDIRAEDRVEFSADAADDYGMPAMTIHYELTETDWANVARAEESLRKAGAALGTYITDGEPRLLPAGSSMHYQGSVRMGEHDDGTSVCDRDSRVWGFANLQVAGNGVIPTPTACNPTLTNVALAVIAANSLVAEL